MASIFDEPQSGAPLRRVARSEDLPRPLPGEPAILKVQAGLRDLLLVRLPDGRPVAFAAHCPHQATPLHNATQLECFLRCPQHGYVYDLRSGQNVYPTMSAREEVMWRLKPGYLPTFAVEERQGWLWVAEVPDPPPAEPPEGGGEPAAEFRRIMQRLARAAPRRPEGPVEHPPESLTLPLGGEVEVVIPTNPLPGHMWRVEIDGAAAAFLGESFDPARARSFVRLHGAAPGNATVRCTYVKPWVPDRPKEVRTYLVRTEAGAGA